MFFSGVAIQRQEITLYLAQVVGIHHQLKKKKKPYMWKNWVYFELTPREKFHSLQSVQQTVMY